MDKKESIKKNETMQDYTNLPIDIDEMQSLRFENFKLKIDVLNINKNIIDKDINILSQEINTSIQQYMEDMKIPKHYRLDFTTMQFVVINA